MTEIKKENQVKSKKRITDHREVFTSEREVNAMLDLVKQETERIDSRFLEPACGTGNFLVEILRRKLAVVESRYKKNQLEFSPVTSKNGEKITIALLKDEEEAILSPAYQIFEVKDKNERLKVSIKPLCYILMCWVVEKMKKKEA